MSWYLNLNKKYILNYLSIIGIFGEDLKRIIVFLCSSLLSVLIGVCIQVFSTQLSGYNQMAINNPVNKEKCTCDCFDGFMRGIHSKVYILIIFIYLKIIKPTSYEIFERNLVELCINQCI